MRVISDSFLSELRNGKYMSILDTVRKDNTLDLELREKSIIVYYRGGKLFELREDSETIVFNTQYGSSNKSEVKLSEVECSIPSFKYSIDTYLSGLSDKKAKMELEAEFQQLIIRSNNYTRFNNISKGTDYYIADSELDLGENGRFDLVGFNVKTSSRSYKLCKMALIEVKYGFASIRGAHGIKKHLSDYRNVFNNKELLAKLSIEMTEVLRQKYYLGLIPGLDATSSDKLVKAMKKPNGMEAIIALGDLNLSSKKLKEELTDINPEEYDFEIYFAQSPFLGYGLYRRNLISLKDLKSLLIH